jgi:hypothetical protein
LSAPRAVGVGTGTYRGMKLRACGPTRAYPVAKSLIRQAAVGTPSIDTSTGSASASCASRTDPTSRRGWRAFSPSVRARFAGEVIGSAERREVLGQPLQAPQRAAGGEIAAHPVHSASRRRDHQPGARTSSATHACWLYSSACRSERANNADTIVDVLATLAENGIGYVVLGDSGLDRDCFDAMVEIAADGTWTHTVTTEVRQ